jgi:UDP-N-acetylmuramyl tripeptide synthase
MAEVCVIGGREGEATAGFLAGLGLVGGAKVVRDVGEINPGDFVVANGDDPGIRARLRGWRVKLITYGFNGKACVTASSVAENWVHCCLQRSLPTLAGGLLEEQEFPVAIPAGRNIYAVLAAATAALMAGVPARRLGAPEGGASLQTPTGL